MIPARSYTCFCDPGAFACILSFILSARKGQNRPPHVCFRYPGASTAVLLLFGHLLSLPRTVFVLLYHPVSMFALRTYILQWVQLLRIELLSLRFLRRWFLGGLRHTQ